jgi:hypothetical protein
MATSALIPVATPAPKRQPEITFCSRQIGAKRWRRFYTTNTMGIDASDAMLLILHEQCPRQEFITEVKKV